MNEGLFSVSPKKSKRHVGSLGVSLSQANGDYIGNGNDTLSSMSNVNGLARRFPFMTAVNRATPFYVRDIVWTGSLWVAISGTQSSTSTDLITWTAPVSLPAKGTGNVWAALGWNGSTLVIVSERDNPAGSGGDYWIYTGYSTNSGTSWSSGTSFDFSAVTPNFGYPSCKPTWTGTTWLFFTAVAGIIKSTDSTNWTRTDTTIFGSTSYHAFIEANGSGTVLAVKDQYNVYRSTDHGSTWALSPITGGGGSFLVYDTFDSKFVAINGIESMGVSTSSDGLTWTECQMIQQLGPFNSIPSKVVCTPDYYLIPWLSTIIAVSKHRDDAQLRTCFTDNEYTNLQFMTASKCYAITSGDSKLVMYPGYIANYSNLGDYNTPVETFNIATLDLNPNLFRFVQVGGSYTNVQDITIRVR